MGVNYRGINNVVHYSLLKDMHSLSTSLGVLVVRPFICFFTIANTHNLGHKKKDIENVDKCCRH
jgi:hypothetical protein